MSIKFQTKEDVYQFLHQGGDAWSMPLVEEYVGMCDPDELDLYELNQWLETERHSLEIGYEEFVDDLKGEGYA